MKTGPYLLNENGMDDSCIRYNRSGSKLLSRPHPDYYSDYAHSYEKFRLRTDKNRFRSHSLSRHHRVRFGTRC